MDDIKKLLLDLHNKTPSLRNSATIALWDHWYVEAGEIAETYIHKGERLMGLEKFEEAQVHFEKVIKDPVSGRRAHSVPVDTCSRHGRKGKNYFG